jgi:hypothetical protein
MSTPAYYRAKATRFRELAGKSSEAGEIKRWLQMAVEYDQLAESMDSVPHAANGNVRLTRVPMQQQPIQQQQSRSNPKTRNSSL